MFSSLGNPHKIGYVQQLRKTDNNSFKKHLSSLEYNYIFELYEILKQDKLLWSKAGYVTESEDFKINYMMGIYPELKLIN